MSILHKIFGKSFKLLSIGIVVALITTIFTVSAIASTPEGPFTLTYTGGPNGYIEGITPQIVDLVGGSGSAVEAVPLAGYHFVNWSDDKTDSSRTDTNVLSDITVTANFAIDTFTLDYVAGAGGSLEGETSQTVEYMNSGSAVEAIPDTGYQFVDWSDGSTNNPRTDIEVDEDINVTANFSINSFSLYYSAGENGNITGDDSQTVDYMADGTPVTAVAFTGYHFESWNDGSNANPRTDSSVTADINVIASFVIDTFTLNYAAGTNGSLTGDISQTVCYEYVGTAVTAVADTGYQFVNWSDGSKDNPRIDTAVTSNVDVTANFAFVYTVTFDSQDGSTVPDQYVVSGGKVNYPTAPAKTGLYFAGWYKEASCDNIWNSNIDIISSNTTLYAKWNETAPKIAVFYGDSRGTDIQAKLVSTGLFSQIDMIPFTGATPTLAELKQYNAVFIYSDYPAYNDPAAWGDVLADYVDYGGGVVLAAFTFVVPGGEMGIDGRISTDGYLPFTQAPQRGEYNMTLVADVISDPILNGVNSFNGGERGHYCEVSLTSGATLIAHWSNGYPLVATKKLTVGRIVGLNFFPLSSDVGSDYWISSTNGALLMANSLIWAASTGGTISAPNITSDGGGDTASVNAAENQTAVTTVTATDPDSTTLTYNISGGLDASLFNIDSSSGVLTFKVAPNFESPADLFGDGIYEVTVQVSDGELSDSQDISVTVTDTIDAPKITSDGGEATASINAKENQTAVTTLTATDPDSTTLYYSISGGIDAGLFSIDSSSGVLTFKVAPDYETKTDANIDGIYEVTVQVSDGTLTDTQDISVTVTILTPVDLLNDLISDIYDLQSGGSISKSTANGLVRTIDKAIVKINAGDNAGAIKLLNSLKTTINRQIPRKIPSGDLVDQINLVIGRLT